MESEEPPSRSQIELPLSRTQTSLVAEERSLEKIRDLVGNPQEGIADPLEVPAPPKPPPPLFRGSAAGRSVWRVWLICLTVLGYVIALFALYVLMHSGLGERQSETDCWYGQWVVTAMDSALIAACFFAFAASVLIARVWCNVRRIWRVGAMLGMTFAGIVLIGVLYTQWTFDPACGL
jgi:hypothetical protein